MRLRLSGLTMLGGLVVVMAIRGAPAAEPALADAQADVDAARYPAARAKIARILSGTAAKPGAPQRYDLFMLRGECMLHDRDSTGAVDAFAHARQEVDADRDADKAARARAMELLLRASPHQIYRPSKDSPPIDIVAPESRKKAMAALLEQQFAAADPKIRTAIDSPSLLPTKALLPTLADLYSIELVATGDVMRTRAAIAAFDEHARQLLDAELLRIQRRVDDLNQLANEAVLSEGPREQLGYRGLTSPERDELRSFAGTLLEIQKVIRDGQRINSSIGSDAGPWMMLMKRCSSIEATAEQAYQKAY